MHRLNQGGFSAIEAILAVALLAGLAGAGWYVVGQNRRPAVKTEDHSAEEQAAMNDKSESAEWREVTSVNGTFSLRIPDGWKVFNYQSADLVMGFDENITYTKGTPATIVNDDAPGRDGGVGFVVQRPSVKPVYAADAKVERTDFTRDDGVKGTRYYEVYKSTGEEAIGPADGTLLYEFVFFEHDGKVSQVSYSVLPPAINQIDIVEKAVKTLTFN